MKTKLFAILAISAAVISAPAFADTAQETQDKQAINQVIREYADSVTNMDLPLAEKIWQTDERTSFIHPRGNEFGWKQVKENFYGKTMNDTFSKRELQIKDVDIQLYADGNAAVATFHWDFPAVFRADGQSITTHGRETQVYEKTKDGWKIVHVHYSNMPITGEKQGF